MNFTLSFTHSVIFVNMNIKCFRMGGCYFVISFPSLNYTLTLQFHLARFKYALHSNLQFVLAFLFNFIIRILTSHYHHNYMPCILYDKRCAFQLNSLPYACIQSTSGGHLEMRILHLNILNNNNNNNNNYHHIGNKAKNALHVMSFHVCGFCWFPEIVAD